MWVSIINVSSNEKYSCYEGQIDARFGNNLIEINCTCNSEQSCDNVWWRKVYITH